MNDTLARLINADLDQIEYLIQDGRPEEKLLKACMALDFAIRAKYLWLSIADSEDFEEVKECFDDAIAFALRAQNEAPLGSPARWNVSGQTNA